MYSTVYHIDFIPAGLAYVAEGSALAGFVADGNGCVSMSVNSDFLERPRVAPQG